MHMLLWQKKVFPEQGAAGDTQTEYTPSVRHTHTTQHISQTHKHKNTTTEKHTHPHHHTTTHTHTPTHTHTFVSSFTSCVLFRKSQVFHDQRPHAGGDAGVRGLAFSERHRASQQ